jgi:hypothetical protein
MIVLWMSKDSCENWMTWWKEDEPQDFSREHLSKRRDTPMSFCSDLGVIPLYLISVHILIIEREAHSLRSLAITHI